MASATTNPNLTPPSSPTHSTFSITTTYNTLLSTDPLLTMPVAAIESLIHLLSSHPPSTISETLSLLSTHTSILKSSVRNPIPVSAGTDLFMRYILSALQSSSSQKPKSANMDRKRKGGKGEEKEDEGQDFKAIRSHLLTNSRLFVRRAKEARSLIARTARNFVRDGTTVLTSGGSRVVGAVLGAATDSGVRFRVVYVRSLSSSKDRTMEPRPKTADFDLVKELRARDVPVACISEGAVAYSMGKIDIVLVGAEGVVENGGVINRMGTYQLGLLAKSAGKPLYVVAESHKFVRLYPLGQYDLPVQQNVLDFRTEEPLEQQQVREENEEHDDDVDFTPPDLITALVTEVGVHTPSAVSEELIKIWY
ncbi:MAG: hypothetical protein Q9190_003753 [Brigantiaea leucoxantha]